MLVLNTNHKEEKKMIYSKDENLEKIRVAGALLDKLEGQAYQRDRYFRQIVEQSDTGVGLIDLKGRWIKVNQALADLLGYDDTNAVRRERFNKAFKGEDGERAKAALEKLLKGQTYSYQGVLWLCEKDSDKATPCVCNINLIGGDQGPECFISQSVPLSKIANLATFGPKDK